MFSAIHAAVCIYLFQVVKMTLSPEELQVTHVLESASSRLDDAIASGEEYDLPVGMP